MRLGLVLAVALPGSLAASMPALLALRGGLDAKWTPNGEAPAPYSTNARQQMGMDPEQMAQMAGAGAGGAQAPAAAPGATLRFSLLSLAIIYLTNNWKLVDGLWAFIMKLLQPLLSSMDARREAQAKATAAEAAKAARAARLARLSATKAKASSAADDEE
jgi:hypothetical protein